jgi:hypothetical protein
MVIIYVWWLLMNMVHEFVGYGSCNYKPSPAVPSPPGNSN